MKTGSGGGGAARRLLLASRRRLQQSARVLAGGAGGAMLLLAVTPEPQGGRETANTLQEWVEITASAARSAGSLLVQGALRNGVDTSRLPTGTADWIADWADTPPKRQLVAWAGGGVMIDGLLRAACQEPWEPHQTAAERAVTQLLGPPGAGGSGLPHGVADRVMSRPGAVSSLLAHLAHGNAGDELSAAVAAFARGAIARTGAEVSSSDRPSSVDEGAAFASGGDAGVSYIGAHGGSSGGGSVAYLPNRDVNAVLAMLSGARGLQLQVLSAGFAAWWASSGDGARRRLLSSGLPAALDAAAASAGQGGEGGPPDGRLEELQLALMREARARAQPQNAPTQVGAPQVADAGHSGALAGVLAVVQAQAQQIASLVDVVSLLVSRVPGAPMQMPHAEPARARAGHAAHSAAPRAAPAAEAAQPARPAAAAAPVASAGGGPATERPASGATRAASARGPSRRGGLPARVGDTSLRRSFVLSIPVARGANWFLAGGGRRMDEEEATAAAAERIAAAAEDGTSLPVRLATDVVRFLYGGTGRREPADGGVVSASLLNAKPAVGGIGVEPRGAVAADALAACRARPAAASATALAALLRPRGVIGGVDGSVDGSVDAGVAEAWAGGGGVAGDLVTQMWDAFDGGGGGGHISVGNGGHTSVGNGGHTSVGNGAGTGGSGSGGGGGGGDASGACVRAPVARLVGAMATAGQLPPPALVPWVDRLLDTFCSGSEEAEAAGAAAVERGRKRGSGAAGGSGVYSAVVQVGFI
ncbi:hypothetical protein FOA52_005749 [Chlamydomonas sp. UWO 241]|nr:hypothetical protein FOA52_005749 [Chlamydomonas sp. UWO 241]